MAIKEFRKDYRTKLSENFKLNEFSCNGKGCCSKTLVDEDLVEALQKIRDHFGKAVYIQSAYRCIKHNRTLGSGDGSQHVLGKAADIKVDSVTPKEVAQFAESIGVKGIGLYETAKDGYFVHIDTREKKAFWYGRAESYRSTFKEKEINPLVLEWQKAAIQDGFDIKADGIWGEECEAVAKQAICKRRLFYKYQNLTKIVQRAVGVTADGKFGAKTKSAVATWQKRFGLIADGCVGLNTWKKILGIK